MNKPRRRGTISNFPPSPPTPPPHRQHSQFYQLTKTAKFFKKKNIIIVRRKNFIHSFIFDFWFLITKVLFVLFWGAKYMFYVWFLLPSQLQISKQYCFTSYKCGFNFSFLFIGFLLLFFLIFNSFHAGFFLLLFQLLIHHTSKNCCCNFLFFINVLY